MLIKIMEIMKSVRVSMMEDFGEHFKIQTWEQLSAVLPLCYLSILSVNIKVGLKKAGFVICIILFIFYIAFSDSRNGLVSLLVGITTWIFVWISQKKKDTRKLVINGCIAVLAGSICLVVPISIKKGYNYLAQIENRKKY